jgi:hypothetical protein
VNAAFVAGLLALAVGSALVLRAWSTSGVGQAKSQLELAAKLVVIPGDRVRVMQVATAIDARRGDDDLEDGDQRQESG